MSLLVDPFAACSWHEQREMHLCTIEGTYVLEGG